MVIKVDRSPITREWTAESVTGTKTANQAIYVESKESIGFSVGINITAMVLGDDTAKFLYLYPGKSLSLIMDNNIRGLITTILSTEFGSRYLENCRSEKKEISEITFQKTSEHFKEMGITITNLGIVGGLSYVDETIQLAINDNFVSEMNIIEQENKNKSQRKINTRNVEIAKAEAKAAIEFQKAEDARVAQVRLEIEKMKAQANLNMSERWSGSLPSNILPSGSNLLLGLGTQK